MSVINSSSLLKLTTVLFASIAIIFIVKYFESKNRNNILMEALQIDKKVYHNDLEEILTRYDKEIIKNKKLEKLEDYIKRTEQTSKKDVTKFIKDTIYIERFDSTRYDAKLDFLTKALDKEKKDKKTLTNLVNILINKNKDLKEKNASSESSNYNSKNLTATKISIKGLRTDSDENSETDKYSDTNQLKICFTLLENKAALKGNKDIYIQILNPKNNVVHKIGENIISDNKLLNFSIKTNIYYNSETIGTCTFFNPLKEDLFKGTYKINIYSGIYLIGNSSFTLK